MRHVFSDAGKIASPLVILALAAPASSQTPFSWEAGGEWLAFRSSETVTVEDCSGGQCVPVETFDAQGELDEFTLDGVRFFSPVTPGDGPLSRAAFISRASSLGIAVDRSDTSGDFGGRDARGAQGTLLLVSPERGWTFGTTASYGRSQDGDSITRSRVAIVDAGRYIGERAAIRIGAVRTWARQDLPGFTGKVTVDSQFAQLELVGDLGATWDYALDATWRLGESGLENAQLEARGTLFPSPMLEIGAEFTAVTGNPTARARTYGVFGRWFVTERWSASLRYGWFEEDERSEAIGDEYNWTVGVRRRF